MDGKQIFRRVEALWQEGRARWQDDMAKKYQLAVTEKLLALLIELSRAEEEMIFATREAEQVWRRAAGRNEEGE